jgi:hypothetical protein
MLFRDRRAEMVLRIAYKTCSRKFKVSLTVLIDRGHAELVGSGTKLPASSGGEEMHLSNGFRSPYRNALADWLVSFSTASSRGSARDAVAGSSAPQAAVEWGSYDTKKACEQDRTNYLTDPVVGARMKAAKCVRMRLPHPSAKGEL